MLYHLLFPLHTTFSVLNVTRYITFRTAAASLTALSISFFAGPRLIRTLRDFQIGQVIRHEGPATHRTKAGTPTMGGLLILAAAVIPTLLWADLTNIYIWIAVLATTAYGGVGFADDYLKITRHSHHGLIPRYKMGAQVAVALVVGGVFVAEALSVIIQVASFRLTGQRVFRMAPLHHHFELIGWSEPKVITRFVIVGIIFALLSLTTLKLR